ncbi:hypothetical protein TNIN_179211 [Trichonephila inaurata madagascariensis]|uniref:Uncharacterized protein n=1 Tax=Trichonephila inaurata madagascariensis TaxID=2747483 RepID=A0A8X7CHF5_9ARAC|nr:hypothetical protein TNIN_179211 [Trichonephila inaurata madagascariensis]
MGSKQSGGAPGETRQEASPTKLQDARAGSCRARTAGVGNAQSTARSFESVFVRSVANIGLRERQRTTKVVVDGVDSNWSFQKVICSHHLREVYGLDIWYYKLETESATHVVGPFLIVKSDFSFKKNDVVFPEKGFIDKIYRSKDVTLTEEDLQFRLNPKIVEYVQQLVTAAEKNDSRSDQRYQYEIIRNISESDINAIGLPRGHSELSGESFPVP